MVEASLLASISSDQSGEDISNLQLKGSQPTPDTDHKQKPSKPTKPILKHRHVDYPGPTREQGLDGNWYTNPLDSTYYPAHNYHQVKNDGTFLY